MRGLQTDLLMKYTFKIFSGVSPAIFGSKKKAFYALYHHDSDYVERMVFTVCNPAKIQ